MDLTSSWIMNHSCYVDSNNGSKAQVSRMMGRHVMVFPELIVYSTDKTFSVFRAATLNGLRSTLAMIRWSKWPKTSNRWLWSVCIQGWVVQRWPLDWLPMLFVLMVSAFLQRSSCWPVISIWIARRYCRCITPPFWIGLPVQFDSFCFSSNMNTFLNCQKTLQVHRAACLDWAACSVRLFVSAAASIPSYRLL